MAEPLEAIDHAPLTRDAAVQAALDIVDREGLAALTMRHLGRELGVEAMSIYHHIANKDALLDALVGELLARVGPVDEAGAPPDLLEQMCRQIRAALRAHPNLVPLAAARLPKSLLDTPAAIASARRLVEFGFDEQAAQWILISLVGFALGQTLIELANSVGSEDGDAAFETGLRFLLLGLRDELGL